MLSLLCLDGCVTSPASTWQSLFSKASLAPWTPVIFGGDGTIHMQDGAMILEAGSPLTGVIAAPNLPREYELRLRAVRLQGNDFFCGLTFPVRGSHLTLVLGGWGGAVCGLSNLDDMDAAHNDTRRLRHFNNGVPVQVVLRVSDDRVEVDLDDKEFLRVPLADRTLLLRAEMRLCQPLGFASFATRSALLACDFRPLPSKNYQ
jgi:hypothetical protein